MVGLIHITTSSLVSASLQVFFPISSGVQEIILATVCVCEAVAQVMNCVTIGDWVFALVFVSPF